jgi:hypothetical protein
MTKLMLVAEMGSGMLDPYENESRRKGRYPSSPDEARSAGGEDKVGVEDNAQDVIGREA